MKLNFQDLMTETTGIRNFKTILSHYGGKIFCIILALVFYIQLRYECEEAIYDIDVLKRELDEARFTDIARWGELTGMNKPEIVRRKVEESHVQLTTSTEPPIALDR
jgi:hypothetical protein